MNILQQILEGIVGGGGAIGAVGAAKKQAPAMKQMLGKRMKMAMPLQHMAAALPVQPAQYAQPITPTSPRPTFGPMQSPMMPIIDSYIPRR